MRKQMLRVGIEVGNHGRRNGGERKNIMEGDLRGIVLHR